MKIRVWDLPTRVFHWTLVALVAGAFVTEKMGGNAMVWHGRIGLAILGLLVFRIAWGFLGSTYARFGQFVRGPAVIRDYLKGRWHGLGHTPLGALSVLALLSVLSVQAITGLFASEDDVAFEGPLYPLVSSRMSDWITEIHEAMEGPLLLLVAAHIAAILFYIHVKKDSLVKPMLTGWKEAPEGEDAQNAKGGGLVPFLIAIAIAGAAVWAAAGGLLPPPPPPAPTPDW